MSVVIERAVSFYLCTHNHVFMVLGPHLFDTRHQHKRIWQLMRPGWDPPPSALRRNCSPVWIECLCGAGVKRGVNPKAGHRAVEAVYTVGGVEAVRVLAKLPVGRDARGDLTPKLVRMVRVPGEITVPDNVPILSKFDVWPLDSYANG